MVEKQRYNTYAIAQWGSPYFIINSAGHVEVRPNGREGGDLYELVQTLIQRGIEPPILLRFDGILRDRIRRLHTAFEAAIREFSYRNLYYMAYPIKVNPQRHVVEMVQRYGEGVGLEVGSKPELLAVLTLEQKSTFLLCNGYKDAEYIDLALLAQQLGRRTIIIIEQLYEVPLILERAALLGVQAEVGLRMRPSSRGAGRWQASGGEQAKFGLSAHEMMECVRQLKAAKAIEWVKLLHFHIGSQIPAIEAIQKALIEGARMYTELKRLCPALDFFDAGGGLAVDYDGSKTITDSSMNYTLEEYARNVVSTIGEACLEADIPDPILITESGRAIAAYHAVLVTEVIDVASSLENGPVAPVKIEDELVQSLYDLYQSVSVDNCLETLHDAVGLKEISLERFIHGQLKLEERASCEYLYLQLIAKIQCLAKELPFIPQEIEELEQTARNMYFCNFSVFQSLPDAWAIQQIFPIMPLHCLNEQGSQKAILADLSCDSDGKIDRFIGQRGQSQSYLELHATHNTPYYIGIFLIGAYQEILGGLHNLFGDTNVIHVEINKEGRWEIKQVVEGDTIEEVLQYAQYRPEQLVEQLRALIEQAVQSGRLSNHEAAEIQKVVRRALKSYTYLVV